MMTVSSDQSAVKLSELILKCIYIYWFNRNLDNWIPLKFMIYILLNIAITFTREYLQLVDL